MSSSIFSCRRASRPQRLAAAGVLSALFVASAAPALAGACGDNVDGERVACRCDDNVVSDTVLWATDPVVSGPCRGNALTILAPAGSDGITLNLGGQTLIGTGRGVGINVVNGGKLGSVIVGGDTDETRAAIVRFDTGIRASGRNVLREVRALDVRANTEDGLKIRASGVIVEDVVSENNGRHGVAVSGHGNEVAGVVSQGNIGDGVQVRGTGARINVEAARNRGDGLVIGGRGNNVETIRSSDNGGAGVVATGGGHAIAEMQAGGNGKGETAGRSGALK